MRNVFVDGYNVIHTWPELKEMKDYSFEVKDAENRIRIKSEKKYSEKRHLLEDRIRKDILEELEKIRRSH